MEIGSTRTIVTGAAGGLGRSTVAMLLKHGARVAALDASRDGLQKLVAEMAPPPGTLFTYPVDVSKEDQVVAVVRQANQDIGIVNALVNHAGIYLDGLLVREDGSKFPLAQWRRVVDVDLTGTFLMVREVAAAMIASQTRPGVIINISSVSRHGNVGQSPYSAAKAGVVADSRLWARELGVHEIRVAAISPGFVDTPILRAMDPATLQSYVERIPLGRLGKPEEIDAAIRFVIECDYFTGECLEVNGGFLF